MASSTCPTCSAETRLLPNTARPLGEVHSYMMWQCTEDGNHVFAEETTAAPAQSRSFGDH